MTLDAITQRARTAWHLTLAALHDGLHEAADADCWEALAVYADALSSNGDIRGELIAFDLHRRDRKDPELERSRNKLLHDWLGHLAERPSIASQYGLVSVSVTDTDSDVLDRVLESAAAGFLSSVRIWGDSRLARRTLDRLASTTNPWLGHLTVTLTEPRRVEHEFLLSESDAAAVLRALPNLASLTLDGAWVMAPITSNTLRHVAVSGYSALGSFLGRGEGIESLVSVDFSFESTTQDGVARATAEHVSELFCRRFPALVQLDLLRNEPGCSAPRHLGGSVNVFRFVRDLSVTKQLAYLRLPAIRSRDDATALQAALDTMTKLDVVSVARCYGDIPPFVHPTAYLKIPPARPWLPRDEIDPALSLVVQLDAETHSVPILNALGVMEMDFERLPVDCKDAWNALWEAISELFSSMRTNRVRVSKSRRLPTAVLARAFAGSSEFLLDPRWRELARRVAASSDVETSISVIVESRAARER